MNLALHSLPHLIDVIEVKVDNTYRGTVARGDDGLWRAWRNDQLVGTADSQGGAVGFLIERVGAS